MSGEGPVPLQGGSVTRESAPKRVCVADESSCFDPDCPTHGTFGCGDDGLPCGEPGCDFCEGGGFDSKELPAVDADVYAARVEAMAAAIHEDCRLEWQAIRVVYPTRMFTKHGADEHYGMAHALVRRLGWDRSHGRPATPGVVHPSGLLVYAKTEDPLAIAYRMGWAAGYEQAQAEAKGLDSPGGEP
jgi:hypothetical protein